MILDNPLELVFSLHTASLSTMASYMHFVDVLNLITASKKIEHAMSATIDSKLDVIKVKTCDPEPQSEC